MVPDLIRKVLAGARPLPIFGSGEQTRTLTHVDDIADGIVTAMASPAGENEDFNVSASEERTVAEIARLIWEACGEDPADFELEHLPSFEVDVQRRWPSVEKARRLLGWEARVDLREGLAGTVEWLREREPRGSRAVTDLVTGGAGFAGRHLLTLLGDDTVAPSRDELDLLDADAVRSTVAANEPRSDLPPRRPGLRRALLAGAAGGALGEPGDDRQPARGGAARGAGGGRGARQLGRGLRAARAAAG